MEKHLWNLSEKIGLGFVFGDIAGKALIRTDGVWTSGLVELLRLGIGEGAGYNGDYHYLLFLSPAPTGDYPVGDGRERLSGPILLSKSLSPSESDSGAYA